jgi:hypothetical protein
MNYEVFGPIDVPRIQRKLDRKRLGEFWDEAEDWAEGLSSAIGIYIYSSRDGETFTPWYVGKTCAKTGFRGEVFQDHKVRHYLRSADFKRGIPCVHFLARVAPKRLTFSRWSAAAERDIDFLETAVIAMALRANNLVRNDKKTWFNRNLRVPGIMGRPTPGRRTSSAATLRRALRLQH